MWVQNVQAAIYTFCTIHSVEMLNIAEYQKKYDYCPTLTYMFQSEQVKIKEKKCPSQSIQLMMRWFHLMEER